MLAVVSWWLIIEVLGLLALPVALRLFCHLPDRGYAFARPLGLLLTGYVLDALEAEAEQGQAEAADVERLLGTANALPWQQADPVGEGEEYRANQGEEVHASALTLYDAPVHVSVVVAG